MQLKQKSGGCSLPPAVSLDVRFRSFALAVHPSIGRQDSLGLHNEDHGLGSFAAREGLQKDIHNLTIASELSRCNPDSLIDPVYSPTVVQRDVIGATE